MCPCTSTWSQRALWSSSTVRRRVICSVIPVRTAPSTEPAGGVYSRVRELVRDVIDDTHVQPNHAWRYTFKTYGLEAGIER